MIRFSRIGAVVAVGAFIALTAPPAQAADYQPDGLVKVKGAPSFLGNNVYNTNGNGQSVTTAILSGGVAKFIVKAQNDGTRRDRLIVFAGGGDFLGGWKINVFKGTNDVTAAVFTSGYKTPKLKPGESVKLTMRMKHTSDDPEPGDFNEKGIQIDSKNDIGSLVDVLVVEVDAGVT